MIISRRILLKKRNFSDKNCRENQNTLYVKCFFRKSCRLWDNVEKYGKARQVTRDIIRRMLFECWISKATDTHSEYIILIAFARQQWLRERVLMLLLYVRCLSYSYDSPWYPRRAESSNYISTGQPCIRTTFGCLCISWSEVLVYV